MLHPVETILAPRRACTRVSTWLLTHARMFAQSTSPVTNNPPTRMHNHLPISPPPFYIHPSQSTLTDEIKAQLAAATKTLKLHRQPERLEPLLDAMGRALTTVTDSSLQDAIVQVEDMRRTDASTRRLDVIHNGDHRDTVDRSIENTIQKWRPGTFASEEMTPAFTPFSTACGRIVTRWANMRLDAKDTDGPRIEIDGGACPLKCPMRC